MKGPLTLKQKQFCQYFALDAETCGNGVKSYALAYGYDLSDSNKYKSAKTNANRLLGNPAITDQINELLKERKLTHTLVDNQLDFLIQQNSNLATKLQAINTFYKINGNKPEKEKGFHMLSERAMELARPFIEYGKQQNKT